MSSGREQMIGDLYSHHFPFRGNLFINHAVRLDNHLPPLDLNYFGTQLYRWSQWGGQKVIDVERGGYKAEIQR